jgi:hypothetical protein
VSWPEGKRVWIKWNGNRCRASTVHPLPMDEGWIEVAATTTTTTHTPEQAQAYARMARARGLAQALAHHLPDEPDLEGVRAVATEIVLLLDPST